MFFLEAVASGIQFAILAILLGALVTAGFILPRGESAEIRRSLFFLSRPLLAAFLFLALGSLLIQGAKLQGGTFPSIDILSRYLLRTQSGKIWLAREAYAALLLLSLLCIGRDSASVKRSRWLFLLSLPLAASRSLTSHSIAVKESVSLAVSADAIHLIATALWAGGLPALSFALYQGWKHRGLTQSWGAETVGNFSRVALTSVAAILLTGIYQSWIHVQKLSLLWETPYGRVLSFKLCLFSCMLGLGALNFFFTKRSLKVTNLQHEPGLEKRAILRISAETIVGLSVLLTAGFLTTLPPGIHSLHLSSQLQGQPPISKEAPRRSFLERLARFVAPSLTNLAPAEGARVTLLSPKEGESLKSDEIPIRYEFVKGKRGHHLHAYVDEQLMGMFSDPESGTLTGISPGRHALVVRVVADDHVTELDASDRVEFSVE